MTAVWLLLIALAGQLTTAAPPIEATSLDGKPLRRPAAIPNREKLEADLRAAEGQLAAAPDDPEAIIWLGRRQAYLWRYQDAIATFTRGIERWPDNPKFYPSRPPVDHDPAVRPRPTGLRAGRRTRAGTA
jgi:cytochrome c-type biogenesis protein CcmH/NrfG